MKSIKCDLPVFSLALALFFNFTLDRAKGEDNSLGLKAIEVLKTHCSRCHGPESPGKGGLNFILDRDKLLARNKIAPGNPSESKLFQRILTSEMPPKGVNPRPGIAEVAVLKQWIEAGAPPAQPTWSGRSFLSQGEIGRLIRADLRKIEPRRRRFTRYFTFANLQNAGIGDPLLKQYQQALSKLMNSLSWHPRITVPEPVDLAKAILRIDLRDYQWNADLWNHVLAAYPYRFPLVEAQFTDIAAATGCELPFVRADWFVATASRPPLYHDLLQLPGNDRELERQLRVDTLLEIQEDRVARAGFNGSGVAKNNRLLERHDAAYGAYWRSYDFSDNTDRQNLFDHPLGPEPGQNSFIHAGGELIFNLPNGFQGYLLVDANGRRLDRAPIEIVSDPKRPDRFVETGLSCMSCHVDGTLFKPDQIRAHVGKNSNVFSSGDAEIVHALYPPESKFKALVDEDAERFHRALTRAGVSVGEPEQISNLTLRYEGELDLPAAAAEAGLKPDEFLKRLNGSPLLGRILGPLGANGGTLQRQVFLTSFADLVREFHLGEEVVMNPGPEEVLATASPRRPFEGHKEPVLCIAFAPDGSKALSGGEDGTVRLWDVVKGQEIRPLEGHTGQVLAVAFSPNAKWALSGGTDRTLRLWDLTSGRQLRGFEGHTDRISSVVFSPDGKHALSGSWDQTVSFWDLESGRELFRLGGHSSYVSSVAISPDGRRGLSASYDRTLRLWDLEKGRELRRFEGHTKEIYSVAFSPDGHLALSGGNDHSVRLWDLDQGKELRIFQGHSRPVIQVAFGLDGKVILSASSQYQGDGNSLFQWETKTGRELHHWGGQGVTVWCTGFSADGRQALTGSSDKTLRWWDLAK